MCVPSAQTVDTLPRSVRAHERPLTLLGHRGAFVGRRSLLPVVVLVASSLLLSLTFLVNESDPSFAQRIDQVKMMQFNICGRDCNNVPITEYADLIAAEVLRHRPDFITLNEACNEHARDLNLILLANQAAYNYRHDDIGGATRCRVGNSLLWADYRNGDRVVEEDPVVLGKDPEPFGTPRHAICRKLDETVPRTRLCSTHLTAGLAEAEYLERSSQINNVAGVVRGGVSAGYEVIVGGDFNQEPIDAPPPAASDPNGPLVNQLDPMYPPTYRPPGLGITNESENRRGRCRKKDPTCPPEDRFGSPTYLNVDKKLDYIFMTVGFTPTAAQTGHPSPNPSDHEYLVGVASNPSLQC